MDTFGVPEFFVKHRIPSVIVTTLTNQTISNTTVTVINYDIDYHDPYDMHHTAINNSRLVAKWSGIWLVFSYIDWAAVAANRFNQIRLECNSAGTATLANIIGGQSTANFITFAYQGILSTVSLTKLSVGDHVETFGFQDSGGNLDVNSSVIQPFFGMGYLGEIQ